MTREFRYPEDIDEVFRKEVRLRRIFWCVFLSPFVIMGYWYSGTESFAVAGLVVALVVAIAGLFEMTLRRHIRETMALVGTKLCYDGASLQQVDDSGETMALVHLAEPFKTSYAYHAAGNAIYCVDQNGDMLLRFSSRIEGAEEVVKDILGEAEWPPGASES